MISALAEGALSGASTAGARALDDAVTSYLASRADTPVILKRALATDPEHLMARCLMGYLTRLAGDPANAARARALHEALRRQVDSGAASAWERAHVQALGLWLDDHLHALMAHFEALLDQHPTDILALRMLHYLYFYDGDAGRMRDSVAARLNAFAGHPAEGYVKGMLAFGLEEAGDYAQAEHYGREAVAVEPQDIWAAHAVAHVMEMQGRSADGIAWIRELRPGWQAANNFRFHLDWHEALFHLSEHDLDAALALYDHDVAPAVDDDFYLDLCNAASLLLRLEAHGCDVGERWLPLARVAEHHCRDTELVFASLHYLMPLLKTDHPAAGALLAELELWARRDTTQGHVVRDVARHVAAFLAALHEADHAAAAGHFETFRHDLHRIGGSHAQRELFHILDRQTPENNGHGI
ncbi:MAG: tetratricopeptide repeat protein [Gammaproteobacteria bacterium]|nr:tetratricopeptide repeat protein [Gammaproteobacteria bacterium]